MLGGPPETPGQAKVTEILASVASAPCGASIMLMES